MVFTGPPASVPVPQFAVSPDGRHLVFGAERPQEKRSLWLRSMADPEARQLADTEDADLPFWSPDSRTIAFFSQGVLKKRDIVGTAPSEVVAKATVDMRGGTWNAAGTIVFTTAASAGLYRAAAVAGVSQPLDLWESGPLFRTARWPHFLPDGKQFLFQIRSSVPEQKGIYVGSVDGARPRRIIDNDFGAKYALGRLLFLVGPALMTQPFDVSTHQLSGAREMVARPVAGLFDRTRRLLSIGHRRAGVLERFSRSIGTRVDRPDWAADRVDRAGGRLRRLSVVARR